ncbi:MAG: hypothetical protein RMJ44_01755 [Cytophagales bacterium]|nr:hypothetical protein [Bernardetiaceae bacterium]MDW8209787.1 hypothetical protein [Cytophagales bacterium]
MKSKLLLAVTMGSLLCVHSRAAKPLFCKTFALSDSSKIIRIEQPQEVVFLGKEQIITWTTNFNDTVQIELYRNEMLFATIEYKVPSRRGTNSIIWKVPSTLAKGSNYRIVVQSTSYSEVQGKTNLLTFKADKKSKRIYLWAVGGLLLATGLSFLGIQLAKPKTKPLPEPPLPEGP